VKRDFGTNFGQFWTLNTMEGPQLDSLFSFISLTHIFQKIIYDIFMSDEVSLGKY
jgi:hypothetical protein